LPTKDDNYMKSFDLIAATFLFVGGLNWGLIGLFGFDLIAWLFGEMSMISRIIYVLVGIRALYDAAMWKAIQRRCGFSGFWRNAESQPI
jgi:uncharacterized membrane protein YuzA (DUF378 family)